MRLLPVLVFLVAACTDRTAAPVVPDAAAVGRVETIFVGTTRARDDRGYLGRDRAAGTEFLRLGVSVPPERRRGRVHIGGTAPDPRRDFVITSETTFAGPAAFRSALASQLRSDPGGGREVTIYVHGYNNSFSEGAFRLAQLVSDLNLPGTAVHYSWPSAANPFGYTYDRDSILFARDGLEQLLREVHAAGPSRIILAGHSMGSLMIMESLRQIELATPGWSKRALGAVILLSPDIDLDLFKMQATRMGDLPEPFAIFVSNRDRALQLSQRLNGSRRRLGGVQDAEELKDFPVTLVDISRFSSGAGHFTTGDSPVLLGILSNILAIDRAFRTDRSGNPGVLPGTIITVQNATQLILSPTLVP